MTEGDQAGCSSKKQRAVFSDYGFTTTVLSWSLDDIFNKNLFKDKVEKIPESFQSYAQYFESFKIPLLEETRAQLLSGADTSSEAPFAGVTAIEECKPYGEELYEVKVDYWRNRFNNRGKEPYKTLPGDILLLADAVPGTYSDLRSLGSMCALVCVTKITEGETENDSTSTCFKVKASKNTQIDVMMKKSMILIFLANIIPNRRIWCSLHISTNKGNLKIIEQVLCTDSAGDENCKLCSVQREDTWDEKLSPNLSYTLNDSQVQAVLACLRRIHCEHKAAVELIWGPPGTGKTKTVSVLLFTLLRMKCRTLVCTPTNVAITEVASRVVNLVKESLETESGIHPMFYPLGDVLLFGNNERLNVGAGLEDIYLDYRVERLAECFAPCAGWRNCLTSLIDFLENCVSEYYIESDINEKENRTETECSKVECKSFLEFVRKRFHQAATSLKNCISAFCTHIPKKLILKNNFQDMVAIVSLLESMENLLSQDNLISEELEELFTCSVAEDFSQPVQDYKYLLQKKRSECHSSLRILWGSLNQLDLPNVVNNESLKNFCFAKASLILCTASSSYKLHSVKMKPLNFLVIDEAAQLKECESTIPLQLEGIKHAILIGDECQLPAMVESRVSFEAGFGRSLFQRLTSLDYTKHLLNIQYRMHPAISFFPNSQFYNKQILDGPNVKQKGYERNYFQEKKFGPYSFINIIDGREESSDVGHSLRNMVEVSVVMKLLQKLYKAWNGSKQELSIGVVSPYTAQVVAIQEKLRFKYQNCDGFRVKVKSIDGFQGGEEDIIIISTVRSNSRGSIEFISQPQRINVALTRARHCLCILGNEKTLIRSESIWRTLVGDAKNRQCFFNADEDKDLAGAIVEVKKEYNELDQLLNPESILFRNQRWKVIFSDNFLKSFKKLASEQTKKSVINLLLKLSNGWRPKNRNINSVCESSLHIIKQFKVESCYIICTIDIAKERQYRQVLKVWDILPLEEVQKLVKRLDNIFVKYTDDFISRCKEKCFEGDLEVPKTWAASSNIVRIKNLVDVENGSHLNEVALDGRSYVENSKVNESLLLMKFYPLSQGIVSHLLSEREGRDLDLPFEVTDEQLEMINFPRSTFIHGRSGTGKTTILTMKLFQQEEKHHMAMEGSHIRHRHRENEAEEDIGETNKSILRQLFVTVSPKLCVAVKQHVSNLKSSVFGGKYEAESTLIDVDDIDDVVQFKDIPNSFVDIPHTSYPLVITFHKFLLMLDGTLGTSYFERFCNVRNNAEGVTQSLKTGTLQTFIRTKEVTYERFSSLYWPHFNEQQRKQLDSSRVFTEIISHIKGGLQSMEVDGILSKEDYVQLEDARSSTLSNQMREIVYDIFLKYEKVKAENGEFDLADLVIDLHCRLKGERFGGDEMDFVYIDEVQDLTMSQIALFKYICRNVEEGFVFSGDTAQTIARGIDFRFQDIRSLFYNKFVLESGSKEHKGRKPKGQLSEVLSLSQNFRTHSGVLKLAQSIIELLCEFFPKSIDVLKPETSMIYGEPPILLDSENNENVIIKIFGNSGNVGNIVGFGAQQVILVRDDCARKEISNYVGKQALILTIVECKGLEFQDVLLYNFFGCSSLKNQWRVIYKYMKAQGLLDAASSWSFPTFNEAKHNILCAELKQLYVAITRTRQRLWIWENSEEQSKPIFDYWKKKGLVQVRKLDDSLARAMQVASSPEEWRSQGIKLFHEHNYEMATMCFERAGDTYWEKRTIATSLRAAADRMFGLNPGEAKQILKEAAEIFEAIGKADSAARCFFDMGEYERAGRIYLEKLEESDLEKAGQCFVLAGCYDLAAGVYARGSFYPECLTVCSKGKLFDMGLQYIQHWKRHANPDDGPVTRSKDLNKIEQDFLESCAHYYYELKENKSMMKFVKAFHSLDLMRNFLKSLDCSDELLLLEEELGNFVDAANIAKLRGEILRAADLLHRAGNFREASTLTLNYVFSSSLWTHGSKGWPLKKFSQNDELLEKARSLAKNDSNQFHDFVCIEADILSNYQFDLTELNQQFKASKRHQCIRGQILSSRMILDVHLHSNASKYVWVDELVLDLMTYLEVTISKNQLSVETLVYFWNYWKDEILKIFEYLARLDTQDVNDYRSHGDFCLDYFNVLKHYESQHSNLHTIYFLLTPDADWVREVDNRYCRRSGKLVSIDVHQLVSAAWKYWSSELLFVGMEVLKNLEALHEQSIKNLLSEFCQVRSLTHIFEVAKFLLDSRFIKPNNLDRNELQNFVRQSTENFFSYIFPLDWRKSLRKNMISLRETEVCRTILEEVIFDHIGSQDMLSYGQLGRMAVIILGSGILQNELFEKVAARCDKNLAWQAFLKNFPVKNMELQYLQQFHGAVVDTFEANWRLERDYISPDCFLYLVERLLILLCCFHGNYVFTTKSSFIEWLINQEGNAYRASSLLNGAQEFVVDVFKFIVRIVEELLRNKNDTFEWIKKSYKNVKESHSLVAIRLVVIICVLQLNFGNLDYLLYNLLGWNFITDQLPWEFRNALHKWKRNLLDVNLIAEAFKRIGNHLVIVSLGEKSSLFRSPDTIFVDMKVCKCKEDILGILFPEFKPSQGRSEAPIIEDNNLQDEGTSQGHSGAPKLEATDSQIKVLSTDFLKEGKSSSLPSSNSASFPDKHSSTQNTNEDNQLINNGQFWKTLEALDLVDNPEEQKSILLNSPEIKVDVEECINLLATEMNGRFRKNPSDSEEKTQLDEAASMLDEMMQLRAALNATEQKEKNNVAKIGDVYKRLQSKRATMEHLLNQILVQQSSNIHGKAQETGNGIGSGEKYDAENTDSDSGECSNIPDDEGSKVAFPPTINVSGSQDNLQETENKGGGKGKSKKKKKGKGGRKHK